MKSFLNLLIKTIFLTTIGLTINAANAAERTSVVGSDSCQKLAGTQKPFILVLKKGEEIFTAITQCTTVMHLQAASFSGVGAFANPVYGHLNTKIKQFEPHTFNGFYIIGSLNGNLTELNGKPFIHIHSVVADKNNNILSGHLMKGVIGDTAEITIIPFANTITRQIDPESGLQVIQTK